MQIDNDKTGTVSDHIIAWLGNNIELGAINENSLMQDQNNL